MNGELYLRTLLIGDTGLTALVPAARIKKEYPDDKAVFPLVYYKVENDSNIDGDRADNLVYKDQILFEIQVWCLPNTSTTAITNEIIRIMETAGFNREMCEPLTDPVSKHARCIMRWSGELWR